MLDAWCKMHASHLERNSNSVPVAAPSIRVKNSAPSKAVETGQPCPGCGDALLREWDGWRYCWSCKYARTTEDALADAERKEKVPEAEQLRRDIEWSFRDDQTKSGDDPSSGDAVGLPCAKVVIDEHRPEQEDLSVCVVTEESEKTLGQTEVRSVIFTCPSGTTAPEVLLAIAEILAEGA